MISFPQFFLHAQIARGTSPQIGGSNFKTYPVRGRKLISFKNKRNKAERDVNRLQGLPCIPRKIPSCQTNFIRGHKLISFKNKRNKAERGVNRLQGLPCIPRKIPSCQTNFIRGHKLIFFKNKRNEV